MCNPLLAPRLSNKLEKSQNQLEESYARLAAILTDIQMEGLEQLHSTDPKMKPFLESRLIFEFCKLPATNVRVFEHIIFRSFWAPSGEFRVLF